MRLGESVAVACVLALLLTLVALDISDHQLYVVTGASMEPAIGKGSLVIVRATSPVAIAAGDVVTFHRRGESVTHRVASVEERGDARVFTTKGDANTAADDPVIFDGRVGLVVAQVPLAGYVVALVQAYGRLGSMAVALVIAFWLLRERRSRAFPVAARA